MPELEGRLRAVRPEWPEPSAAAEARARAALGLRTTGSSPSVWRSRARRGPRLLAAAALLVAVGAAAAAALIGGAGSPPPAEPASLAFGPVQRIGGPVSYFGGEPDVAVDGRGSVTVVWGRAGRIVASTRPAGGDWSAPERLSDPAVRATRPQVAADRAGNLIVVWKERTAAERVVERFRLPSGAPAGELVDVVGERWSVISRTRPAGGAWEPAERLAPESGAVRDFEQPQLGMSLDGTAVVAWDAGGATFARVRPAGGTWQGPVRLGSGAIEAVDPQLVVSPLGRAIVAWSARGVTAAGRRKYTVTASTLDTNGEWSDAASLGAPSRNPPYAEGAVNDRGDAIVAWAPWRLGRRTVVRAAVRDAGSEWAPAVEAGRILAFGTAPLVGIDRNGRGVVVSLARNSATTMSRRLGGSWAPIRLRPDRRISSAAVVADAAGRTLVAIGAWDSDQTTIGEPGDRGTTLSGRGRQPVLVAGASGTAAIAWTRSDGQQTSAVMVAVAEPGR